MSTGDFQELEAIGLRSAEALRARRMREACAHAWSSFRRWMIGVPVVACVLAGFGIGPSGALPMFAWCVVLAFALPLAAVLVVGLRALAVPLSARSGLALLEPELRSAGRLIAAHEFAGRGPRSDFESAAIEDARSWLPAARQQALIAPRANRRNDASGRVLVPTVSVLIAVIAAWFAPPSEQALPGRTEGAPGPASAVATATRAERDSNRRERELPATTSSEAKVRERTAAPKAAERQVAAHEEMPPRESSGKSGEGASATPTQSSSASDSKGFDSAATPPNEAKSDARPKAKKPAKPQTKAEPSEKKKLEASGATAGKGTGSGSSKNPGATDWQSKDQVTSDEEEPLDNDEEVDDEADESEARGGLQPNLRDRRPAANRDLQIGFGNRPNPDANGRGGPSEQKKSRGVAALVLGVPLPDHVKGHPNPGRTKITQERVEPRPEDAATIAASDPQPRSTPIGTLDRKSTIASPWLDELVRNYFLSLRQPPESKTEQRP